MQMQMGSSSPKRNTPSFFKILLDASANNLSLPPAFVKKQFFEGKFPENPTLKVKTGESWDVKIEEIGGKYCFGNGWMEFVKDNRLEWGDFLVFWLAGDSTFQVAIYGPTCCEKESSSAVAPNLTPTTGCVDVKNPIMVEDEIEQVLEAAGSEKSVYQTVLPKSSKNVLVNKLYSSWKIYIFQLEKITSSNVHYEHLSRIFLEENGIGSSRETVVRERDGEGKEWACWLCVGRDGSGKLCSSQLFKDKELLNGDTCFFRFLGGDRNLFDLQVAKKKRRADI